MCIDFTWRVSDFEELSEGLLTGDDGFGIMKIVCKG